MSGRESRRRPESAGAAPVASAPRIPVWVLENYRRLGWTEAEIFSSYSSLRAADLVHAWAYVDARRQEIDEEIRQSEAA